MPRPTVSWNPLRYVNSMIDEGTPSLEAVFAQAREFGLENHYRDRRWINEDFAFHAKSFLAVFERVKESWIGVNFDASNQVMVGEDPIEVLEVVKHKVWHMHASDRLPGRYEHSVIGEGSVRFDPIFACLAGYGATT